MTSTPSLFTSTPLVCETMREDYLFGLMNDTEEQAFVAHLATCLICQQEVQSHRTQSQWLAPHFISTVPVSSHEHQQLLQTVFQSQPPHTSPSMETSAPPPSHNHSTSDSTVAALSDPIMLTPHLHEPPQPRTSERWLAILSGYLVGAETFRRLAWLSLAVACFLLVYNRVHHSIPLTKVPPRSVASAKTEIGPLSVTSENGVVQLSPFAVVPVRVETHTALIEIKAVPSQTQEKPVTASVEEPTVQTFLTVTDESNTTEKPQTPASSPEPGTHSNADMSQYIFALRGGTLVKETAIPSAFALEERPRPPSSSMLAYYSQSVAQ